MKQRFDRESGAPGAVPPPELSRKVRLHALDGQVVRVAIEASAEECDALRRRFDLEALRDLRAEARLERLDRSDTYRLEGTLSADVTQLCVVTLEPIETVVEGAFETIFIRVGEADPDAPDEAPGETPGEMAGDPDEDEPEPFSGDAIDVGEAVAQELAAMLDPYPRHPDAVVDTAFSADGEPAPRSPFAVLETLRKGPESGR